MDAEPGLWLLLAPQALMDGMAQQLEPGWLTASELARTAAMRQPCRRREFVACRYALRHLLALVYGHASATWRLDAPEGAPPHLNTAVHGAVLAANTYLSLSHSASLLACAVSPQPVGVDMEVVDARAGKRDVLALAGLACTDGEVRQLSAMAIGARQRLLFLQWWTLKESYFKCTETGVDFSRIRRIECRPANVVQGYGQLLARAQSWVGSTPAGEDVVLSVCTLGDALPAAQMQNCAEIAWRQEIEWTLVELPSA
jgi:phosphopantetheinyl transferase